MKGKALNIVEIRKFIQPSLRQKLRTWEVNFGYIEAGTKKNALVKCRLCFECSYKLNFHHKRKELTKKKRKKEEKRKHKKRSKHRDNSSSSSDSSDAESKNKSKEQKSEKAKAAETEKLEKEASEVWSKPIEREEEKSRNDVFDEFLEDLLL